MGRGCASGGEGLEMLLIVFDDGNIGGSVLMDTWDVGM